MTTADYGAKEETEVKVLGIDLAKDVFSVHAVVAQSRIVIKRTVSRARLTEIIAQLKPCRIGMESCGGAHHFARVFTGFGHTVRLMAAAFVQPYRHDGNDAEAICEAVARPNMRFVPAKTLEQQAVLSLHRVR